MKGKPVCGRVNDTKILHIGQAPGPHEEKFGKPFAYTAGKTLFQWLKQINISEEDYRNRVCMAAVCRCFPGKSKSGDRVPDAVEIANCSIYLKKELEYYRPELIIPVGKLAIAWILKKNNFLLDGVIGVKHKGQIDDFSFDWIALPHPSGLNAWNHSEKGKRLREQSLNLLKNHKTVIKTFYYC